MGHNDGYITLSRKFFQTAIWKTARTFNESEAWLDLIQSARFELSEHTARVGGREVKERRGELVASQRYLAHRWNWSEMRVRSFMSRLRKEGMVETETRSGVTIVRLTNYDKYNLTPQDPKTGGNAADNAANSAANDLKDNTLMEDLTQQITQLATQLAEIQRKLNANLIKENNIIQPSSLRSEGMSHGSPPSDAPQTFRGRIIAYYNAKMANTGFKPIKAINEGTKRADMLRARRRQYGDEAIFQVIDKAAQSQFLNGQRFATFDWLICPNNFPKVLEGNYDNTNTANNGNEQHRRTVYQQQQLDNIRTAEKDALEAIRKTISGADGIPAQIPDPW